MEEAVTCGRDRRHQLPAPPGFDDSLVTKTWGRAGTKRRRTETWVFAARNVASMDIETAFDVAKPLTHMVNILVRTEHVRRAFCGMTP